MIKTLPARHILLTAAIILATVSITLLWHFQLVIDDDYLLLPYLHDWHEHPFSLHGLFPLKVLGGHWLLFALLIQIPIAALSHWNTLYAVLAALVILGMAWMYMLRILRRTGGQIASDAFFVAALPLCTFIMWSLDQSGNFFWGWQVAPYLAVLSITATVFYLTQPVLTCTAFTAAITFSVLGIYSYSMSFALLPVAFLLIILHQDTPAHRKCIYAALWASYSAIIIWHYHHAGSDTLQSIAMEPPFFYINFVAHFLSAAIVRFADDLTWPLLMIITVLAGMGIRKSWRNWSMFLRLNLPYLAFMAFACGAGLMTGLGRSAFGLGQAGVSRYITFSNFFWIGIFCIILTAFFQHTKNAKVICAILLCCVALKCANSAQVTRKNINNTRYFETVAPLLVHAYPALPPEIAYNRITLWPNDKLRQDLKLMHDDGLNLFH